MDVDSRRGGEGEPTIYPNIIFKNGKYAATGIDPYFDMNMVGRIQWLDATQGGKNIQPDDNSMFRQEFEDRSGLVARLKDTQSQFQWLGDPCGMKYMGTDDIHCCTDCELVLWDFTEGDTFLNQHAYFSMGKCPYLNLNYASERLKIEIGQERFRRGFVAHPKAISIPGLECQISLTRAIYVTLCERLWCYMCGQSPAEHKPNCNQGMVNLRKMVLGEYSVVPVSGF